MRAILIDPIRRAIRPHLIDGKLSSLQAAVGGLIAWGTQRKTGDVLYVDDEGLLKANPAFFALDRALSRAADFWLAPSNPLSPTSCPRSIKSQSSLALTSVSTSISS